MNKKSHERAADKIGFSVALPKSLASEIQRIADEEHRTRNKQIEHFLSLSVGLWNEAHPTEELPMAAEDPGPYGGKKPKK